MEGKIKQDGKTVCNNFAMATLFSRRTFLKGTVLAGVAIILVSNNLDYDPEITPKTINHVKELIGAGRITEQRIDESYQRIMAMKGRLFA